MYDYRFSKSNIEYEGSAYQLSSDEKYNSEQLEELLLNALEQAAKALSQNKNGYISDDDVFKAGINLLVEKKGFKYNFKKYESCCDIDFSIVQNIKKKHNLNK